MAKIRAAITAVEGYLPDYILTNEELSTMVDTTDEWIMTRIGIKERHILKEEGKGSSDMGAIVVNNILKNKSIDPSEIELIICCTVTPDMLFPATANIIADKCGIKNSFGFDLNAGCSGFLNGLTTASMYIQSGFVKKAIVVGAEKMSTIVDYKDRATCPIFGDGAGAVLLEATEDETGIMDCALFADGVGRVHLHQKAGGSIKPPTHQTIDNREHYIYQEGQPVFKWAVVKMAEATEAIMKRNNLTKDDISFLLPHQANLRIISATGERLGLDTNKVLINIEKYGNTTSATIPILMWENQSKFKKGDNLILTAFGAGFTWGAIWLKWAL
ncbi:MAG: ketoacyl-ACP synthase III [Bacteroidales bacterium]|jgi:3-oxoacyl-[acyl-carrier-protein] synthase-3|uniref:beta-ketoacyl-[acyl-carrier-protein] synthase III n=1 Tax=bioreactor metagenome TaxID=1076179 RepID=A0A644UL71_9ZZZZ|nr:ketoacyl-ACP synthase III [Bacteroidales bacterium]MDD3667133.1 ketoacyl-ACP synthase III [Bacteroidales bacterium]MDD4738651.1 ketoacyl-ACP synthase III [Bacteroidales bacterium]MEA5099957.1 beta-ketoacyl-ACP synthase III [Bacteroidales bacterium]